MARDKCFLLYKSFCLLEITLKNFRYKFLLSVVRAKKVQKEIGDRKEENLYLFLNPAYLDPFPVQNNNTETSCHR